MSHHPRTPRAEALGPLDLGLGSWPLRRARIDATRIALLDGARSLTYGVLADRVDRLAAALDERGVRHGDRVAYLGVNALEVFESFFAAGRLGAVFVPLNYRLSSVEITWMLEDCGAVALVHSSDTDALLAGSAGLPSTLRVVLAIDPTTCPLGGEDYGAALSAAGGLHLEQPVALQDLALLLYTSGTTGRPKAARLSHQNITFNTMNQLAHIDTLSTDRALCIAPLFHCVGLGQVTLPTLFKGGSVEPLAKFDPGAVLERITERRTTSFSAVPTMLQLMADHPSWPSSDLSSLTCVVYGGSPVQERVARAWQHRGVQLQQGYGMTEAAPGVYMALPDGARERPTSVGVPHFFTDVAVASETGPRPVAPQLRGELLVRGPNVFQGYWQRDSSDCFVEEWFRTGDVVDVEESGWAYVVDRVKDMIISGGENVYPAEIEAVAVQLDAVLSCAVVAAPDVRWGEVGSAYVVLRPGAELDEAAFRGHLERNLAKYKVPKHVQFVDELPRNATGKVLRSDLRSREAERTAHPAGDELALARSSTDSPVRGTA